MVRRVGLALGLEGIVTRRSLDGDAMIKYA
jgi:hypothetical protein